MNRHLQIVGAVIVCIFLVSAGVTNSSSHISYYPGLQKWDHIFYEIREFNETAPVYWFTDTGESYAFMANRSSHLLYEFLYVAGKGPSPYDPNEVQAYGNLYVGNLSRSNASMYEMASNLALSIYPWHPGFLASVNWTYGRQQAQAGADTLDGTLNISERLWDCFDGTQLTGGGADIIFDFKQNNGFQNTTLEYSMTTGALLSARTAAGNYKLELTAISSSIIPGCSPVPLTPMQILITIGILFGVIILTRAWSRRLAR